MKRNATRRMMGVDQMERDVTQGRPPYKWTPEIEAEIFDRIAKGESARNICKDDWLPSERTLYNRLADDSTFVQGYVRARERQADAIFEECLAIADSQEGDIIIIDGVDRPNYDQIARAKLRIDTRKWMAGKLRPKVYGDKLELGGAGPKGEIVIRQARDLSDDELAAMIRP